MKEDYLVRIGLELVFFSAPAKSINVIFEYFTDLFCLFSLTMLMIVTQWDLELSSFFSVQRFFLFSIPSKYTFIILSSSLKVTNGQFYR